MSVSGGLELQLVGGPVRGAGYIFGRDEEFRRIVRVEHLESRAAVGGNSLRPHVAGKLVSGVRGDRYVLEDMAVLQVLLAVEIDAQRFAASNTDGGVLAYCGSLHWNHAPVQSPVQRRECEVGVGD